MSKTADAIRVAFRKGYRVSDSGEVTNAVGRVRKCQLRGGNTLTENTGYRVFNVCGGDRVPRPVPVHRLLAYQMFGEDALVPGKHTRHLDGNSLNNTPSNIAMGSSSDNAMDRPKEDRVAHARKAGLVASRYPEGFWEKIRQEYESGLGYKKLRANYGIPLGTLSYQLSKTGARTVVRDPA